MTKITIYSTNKQYNRLVVKEHSGYGVEGEDIVCAGISTLVFTFENSLDQLTDDKYSVMPIEGENPLIDIEIEGTPSDISQTLFKSVIIGFELIKEEYNDFISIDYKEV